MNGEFVNGFFTAVPFTLIADSASVYNGLFSIQNLLSSSISAGSKVIPNTNSRLWKADIMRPLPSSLDIIPYSPFGPVQADLVNINWQKMHLSWPKENIGLSFMSLQTLEFPPKRNSGLILVSSSLSGISST